MLPKFTTRGGRVAVSLTLLAALLPAFAADVPEEQKLTASGGSSVAMSDDGCVAVVGDIAGNGGAGAAYVYTRPYALTKCSGTTWTMVATLVDIAGASGDQFGASVAISGDGLLANIAVGAPGANSSAGRIHVYSGAGILWPENTWDFSSPLTSAGKLGSSVSIQGLRVVAGAPAATVNGKPNTGVAVVWDSTDGGVFFSRVTFRPNGGQSRSNALFGTSVSLSGNTVLVGAPNFTTGQQNSGSVFVFANNGGAYSQVARLRPANTKNNFAGTSVSLFGDNAAFGAPGNSSNRGAVYVYTRSSGVWPTSPTATITDPGNTSGDLFGSSVSQLGSFVIAGAPGSNGGDGATYEFGSAHTLLNQFVPSDFGLLSNAQFGFGTGVNAGRAISGAPGDASAYIFKFLQESTTTITCFSSDANTCVPEDPSLTGVPYYVFVHVEGDGITTATGSVGVDDSAGGTCTIASLDGSGNGACQVTSSFFGELTMTASYNGDDNFSASQGSAQHTISGNHLVFNPDPPADVPQGLQFSGTVEVHDGAEQIVTSDSATQVTVVVTDTCGNPNTIVQNQTVVNGVATISGAGTRFYTLATNLDVSATSNNSVSAAATTLNVIANDDMIFPNSTTNPAGGAGFEDCSP